MSTSSVPYTLMMAAVAFSSKVRNNAWVTHGLGNRVANEVGTGITPRSKAPDEDFAKQADALWKDWIAEADADGTLDLNGLIALAVRSRQEGGECFVRLRPRRLQDGLTVPLQVQLLEGELCPHDYHQPLGAGEIRAGIEFNAIGKRVAYWLYRSHPGEYGGGWGELVRVPADSVLHHYTPLRPGQIRGVPWTIPALIKARDFDEYDDAELVRKKTRSSYTGVIRREAFTEDDWQYDPFTGQPVEKGGGLPAMNVEPGSFPALLPGEEIQMFEGDKGGEGYAAFVRQQLLGVAAGLDIPYELLSGDMRDVSDRVLRVVLNEYHRVLEQSQWLVTIPQLCQRIWAAFIDAAVFAGKLTAADYADRRREYLRVEWRVDGWKYVHPLQDVQAKALEVAYGMNSRADAAAERGRDVEDVDRQNAQDAKRAKDLGLVYEKSPTLQSEDDQN